MSDLNINHVLKVLKEGDPEKDVVISFGYTEDNEHLIPRIKTVEGRLIRKTKTTQMWGFPRAKVERAIEKAINKFRSKALKGIDNV